MNIMNLRNKLVNESSMLGQISVVAGGTVIAQALNMLCTPVLSRIYSPEDFGVMSVFVSVMSILVPLSSMRYYLSVALPKTKRYSDACLILSFLLEIATTVAFFLVALLFGNKLLQLCGIAKLIPYRFMLPAGIFFYGLYMLLTQWAIRNAIFGIIARTKITQSASGNAIKIGMGLLGLKPLGLIIGTIVSYGGGITSIFCEMVKKGLPKSCKSNVKRVAIKYRKFPMYDTVSALLNTARQQVMPVLIFAYFGAKITGFYSMANQLLVIPSVFIGDAIGQVFLQRASRAKYEGGLDALTLKTYKSLIRIGMFPLLLLSLFSPAIFSFVLGNQWVDAGIYARLICFFVLFSFCFSPISATYSIMSKQDRGMYLVAFNFLVQVVSFVFAAKTGNAEIAIGVLGIVAGLCAILMAYNALAITGISAKVFEKIIFYEAGYAICLTIPIVIVSLVVRNILVRDIVAIVMLGIFIIQVFKDIKTYM